jgi:hydrogenase expression/formation protein HypC
MCLGVPGKIVEMYEQGGLLMGKIDFGGVAREVCLAYVPEAKLGDYTMVHVGFALNLLDEAEAQETLALLREIGAFEEEFEARQAAANEEIMTGGPVAGG